MQFLTLNHQMAMVKRSPMERVFKGHCFDSFIGLRFDTAISWFKVRITGAVLIGNHRMSVVLTER